MSVDAEAYVGWMRLATRERRRGVKGWWKDMIVFVVVLSRCCCR